MRAVPRQPRDAKAGDAIRARLPALYPGSAFPSAAQLLAGKPGQPRACGFSASNVATIRGLVEATLEGVVPAREQAPASRRGSA